METEGFPQNITNCLKKATQIYIPQDQNWGMIYFIFCHLHVTSNRKNILSDFLIKYINLHEVEVH